MDYKLMPGMNYKIDTTEKRTSDLENKLGYFFSLKIEQKVRERNDEKKEIQKIQQKKNLFIRNYNTSQIG